MAEEKQQSRQASLTLQVMNGNELESGRAAKCLFSENGGDIGHTPEYVRMAVPKEGGIKKGMFVLGTAITMLDDEVVLLQEKLRK